MKTFTDENGKKYKLVPIEEENKELTYSDICETQDQRWYFDFFGNAKCFDDDKYHLDKEEDAQKIKILIKLFNIASYFNGDWKPEKEEYCHYIDIYRGILEESDYIQSNRNDYENILIPHFKNVSDAKTALEMIKEDLKELE